MPGELLQQRIADAARRLGRSDHLDNLQVYSWEFSEQLGRQWPLLGELQPLNTELGMNFLLALVQGTEPDVVVFDNVQALLVGDLREESTWGPTTGLVQQLTSRRIGQLWLDHTGHAADHQYGTSTKSWRFNSVGLMSPVSEDQRVPGETALQLSFEHPGKCRRRTPANWSDFATTIFRLREDRWTGEPVEAARVTGDPGKVAPSARLFHNALFDAMVRYPGPHPGSTTRDAWEAECLRRGLVEPPPQGEEGGRERNTRRSPLRTACRKLLEAGWIGIDGERVNDLTRDYS